jgi:hypothetical protein
LSAVPLPQRTLPKSAAGVANKDFRDQKDNGAKAGLSRRHHCFSQKIKIKDIAKSSVVVGILKKAEQCELQLQPLIDERAGTAVSEVNLQLEAINQR